MFLSFTQPSDQDSERLMCYASQITFAQPPSAVADADANAHADDLGKVRYTREKLGDQQRIIGRRIDSTFHSPRILTHRAFAFECCSMYLQITPWP